MFELKRESILWATICTNSESAFWTTVLYSIDSEWVLRPLAPGADLYVQDLQFCTTGRRFGFKFEFEHLSEIEAILKRL
jgi:hypothetical protein